MTYSALREKVEHQISQLPLERLFLVSSFIDSIEANGGVSYKQFRRIPPLKRNKKASDLLRHAGLGKVMIWLNVLILCGKHALII